MIDIGKKKAPNGRVTRETRNCFMEKPNHESLDEIWAREAFLMLIKRIRVRRHRRNRVPQASQRTRIYYYTRPLGGAYASKGTEIHLEIRHVLHRRSTLRSNRSFSPILRAELLEKIKLRLNSLSRSLDFRISPFLFIHIRNNFDLITRESVFNRLEERSQKRLLETLLKQSIQSTSCPVRYVLSTDPVEIERFRPRISPPSKFLPD